LNAGHQVLANIGEVLSVPTIAACMGDADIAAFFRKVEVEEIAPHVAAVPDCTPAAYLDLITRRFSNPQIHDTTRRVAFDGSSRHTGFVLPILRDALAAGGAMDGLVLVEALWARMCAGTREDGTVIEANDPHWNTLRDAAQAARTDPSAWLAQAQFYGDLAADQRFAEAFSRWLDHVWTHGARAAVRLYLSGAAR